MADPTIEEKVKQIIVDELGVDESEVTPNARFVDDLGADSLDTVELVMRFEEEFGIEIATSFGPLRGRIWRIGTMGYNADLRVVLAVLAGLERVLCAFGHPVPRGAGVDVAHDVYTRAAPAHIGGAP